MEAATVTETDSLGARIQRRRLHRGYTRKELAKLVGTSDDTIYRYETGQVARPRDATLIRIARVLQVSAIWLLTGEEPIK